TSVTFTLPSPVIHSSIASLQQRTEHTSGLCTSRYVYININLGANRSQKRFLGPLELKLPMVVNSPECREPDPSPLEEQHVVSSPLWTIFKDSWRPHFHLPLTDLHVTLDIFPSYNFTQPLYQRSPEVPVKGLQRWCCGDSLDGFSSCGMHGAHFIQKNFFGKASQTLSICIAFSCNPWTSTQILTAAVPRALDTTLSCNWGLS
ncbi:hypothetical protein STEG23_026901, partial [Scotinomys teguina]